MAEVRLGRYEVEDYELPRVCMTCGARAVGYQLRRFRWVPSWTLIGIFFGLLPYFLINELLAKRMPVWVPYCEDHERPPIWPTLVILGSLCGLLVIVVGLCVLLNGTNGLPVVFTLGAVGFLVWVFASVAISSPTIRPTEITDRSITLKGVSEKFINALKADRRGDADESGDEDRPRARRRRSDDEDRPGARRRPAGDEDDGGYYDPDRRRRGRHDDDEDDR
jgi:hypothetical protein